MRGVCLWRTGSSPVTRTTSPQASYRLRRLFLKGHRRAHSAASPFHKRSRSAHLLGCKRPRDGSLSLSTFCGRTYGAFFKSYNSTRTTSEQSSLCSSSSIKGHACSGYGLAGAAMTPPRHYQPFAVAAAAGGGIFFVTVWHLGASDISLAPIFCLKIRAHSTLLLLINGGAHFMFNQ